MSAGSDAVAGSGPTIVDVWAQPTLGRRPGRLGLPETRRLFDKSGSADLLEQPVGPDELVALMDRAGVDVALLSAWYRPGGWVISNDDVAEFTAAHPDRFRGLAAVDLADPVSAVGELRRAVTELGFVGLRVVPWLWELPPDHRLYYPLYVACVELGIPFCTQVGHTGPLKSSETGRSVPLKGTETRDWALCSQFVLMDEPAQDVAPSHASRSAGRSEIRRRVRRP